MPNKSLNNIITIAGALFLVGGLSLILGLFNISTTSLFIPLVGLVLLWYYKKSKKKVPLYLGLFLFFMGTASFLIYNGFIPLTLIPTVMIFSVAISFFASYLFNKKLWKIILSEILLFVSLRYIMYLLIEDNDFLSGYTFLLLGIFLVILFIFEYKRLGFLPIVLALISYLAGFLSLAVSTGFIDNTTFTVILSVMFIISGFMLILYVKRKNVKVDNDNE